MRTWGKNKKSIDARQGKGPMIDMRWDRVVQLNETAEQLVQLFSMGSRGGRVSRESRGGAMDRVRFEERNLHGPFRRQVHVTHENHGVVDLVLQTSSPGGFNPIDKQSKRRNHNCE